MVSANDEVVANTAKVGITTAQAQAIADNTIYIGDAVTVIATNSTDIAANSSSILDNTVAISDLVTGQSLQNTAIALNTAKAGITNEQINSIQVNTDSIVSLNTALDAYAVAISANFDEISTGMIDLNNNFEYNSSLIESQENRINLNTAKVGYEDALVSANINVVANTAKVGITTEQVTLLGNLSGVNTGDQDISGIATNETSIANTTTLINNAIAGAGLETDGTYIPGSKTNYINAETSLASALEVLDYQIKTNESSAGLVSITQGENTGYRLADANPANYGDIGIGAVDLSVSTSASATFGATGYYSTAMGYNATASGDASTAMGILTIAGGTFSTAMGYNATASGFTSTAMGSTTTAEGDYSTAMGLLTTASGNYSTAMGNNTTASDYGSVVMGYYNNTGSTATSATSFSASAPALVIGNGTGASDLNDAFVIDFSGNVTASGTLTAGAVTYPNTHNETDGQVLISNSSGVANWTSFSATIAASSIVNEDISVSAAIAQSKIYGLTDALDLKAPLASPTFTGTPTLPTGTIGVTQTAGDNTTAVATTAFVNSAISSVPSAGLVSITEGDNTGYRRADANAANYGDIGLSAVDLSYSPSASTSMGATGESSIAVGYDTQASGDRSTAMGDRTSASGFGSTAMGNYTEASGLYSTAMGQSTLASGFASMAIGAYTRASSTYSTAMGDYTLASASASTAMGSSTIASGTGSTAMGFSTIASSYAETAIGSYNTSYTPASATTWDASDRLFVIGNGTDIATSDALVMFKNGNTTLKGELTLTNGSSSYTLPNIDGQANQVLATDGAGTLAWSTPATTNNSVAIATSDYNVLTTDTYVIFTGSATGTITLPSAVGASGKEYTIKNMTANGLTIATTGSEEIWQDVNNITLTVSIGVEAQNNWIKVVSDGTQWISFRGLY